MKTKHYDYAPDRWVAVKHTKNDETVYKILGGWSGGYLDGDSWRMNSGIASTEKDDRGYLVHGYSGSIYFCSHTGYGTTLLQASILNQLIDLGAEELSQEEAFDLFNSLSTTGDK